MEWRGASSPGLREGGREFCQWLVVSRAGLAVYVTCCMLHVACTPRLAVGVVGIICSFVRSLAHSLVRYPELPCLTASPVTSPPAGVSSTLLYSTLLYSYLHCLHLHWLGILYIYTYLYSHIERGLCTYILVLGVVTCRSWLVSGLVNM